jgi:superfamily I DNA/RNA helicase
MEGPISDYLLTDDREETLTLSTIHRSKGLEWPHVMIPGMSVVAGQDGGIMPLDRDLLNGKPATPVEAMAPDDRARHLSQREEERRLIYVALTRGAESVWLGHANQLRFAGSDPIELEVSPAVKEMGLEITPQAQAVIGHHDDYLPGFEDDEEDDDAYRVSGSLLAG